MDSVADYKISLTHYKDEPPIPYVFPTLHEALRFQGLLTGQHAYRSMSIGLREFMFLDKKRSTLTLSRFRQGPNTDRYITRNDVTVPTQLQIWTDSRIDGETGKIESSISPPKMRLAIFTATHLYLINLTTQFTISEEQVARDKAAGIIRLCHSPNVEVSTLRIPNGISLNLFSKSKQRYTNNDDTRFDDSKHDEICLYVKQETGQYLSFHGIEYAYEFCRREFILGHSCSSSPAASSHTRNHWV
ncbi:hypothetical protein FB567DRAFT_16203 [Paraphoma chrysanthemicola]|uniref:Uncharacterized protein n=1 Tax=Paraphoma chrysanthemicola TaxID=798071 RepID=A0A8K0W3S8_9PLEO|nr:hypothetical protein FB567DRAFT_16203 [Paraphoma chrysanthemicola]